MYNIRPLNRDMKKFDFVVGNPPYSKPREDDSSCSNPFILYDSFVHKSCEIADLVALVVPAGWTGRKEWKRYVRSGLFRVLYYPADVFENVSIRSGITVVYLEPGYHGDLNIRTVDGEWFTQSSQLKIENLIPKERVFLNRLRSYPSARNIIVSNVFPIQRGVKGSLERYLELAKDYVSLERTEKFVTPALLKINNGNNPVYGFTTITHPQSLKHLVIFPTVSGVRTIGKAIKLPFGMLPGSGTKVYEADTEKRAELAQLYFSSKFVSFIVSNTKFNDIVSTNMNSWDHIPSPPVISWELEGVESTVEAVDEAIYRWLKMTPDEIKIVDKNFTF